jgi:uncharacterized protein (TIRG00374 family)
MRARRWQLFFSVFLTIGIIGLAYFKRERIALAFESLREARPALLALAIALELFAFFLASKVYDRVLRSLGYRMNPLRLWAIALVAIILSQSVPAGGVATYAFLVQTFKRRGIPPGHATLVASLEALSYAGGMLLLFGFSLSYLIMRTGLNATEDARSSLIAAGVALMAIGAVTFLLTREQEVMESWLLAAKNGVARLLRRNWSDAPIHKLVDELARGRALIAARPGELAALVLIQLSALLVHSLALLVVLYSLGATTSPLVVMAAFGIALITSTFNVLPGGGGTVEAVLVLTLTQFGVEAQAYVAALIFRMINFWLLAPVAAVCYRLLNQDADSSTPPDSPTRNELQTPLAHD